MEYNYIINLKEGKVLLNLFIYNLFYKELKILWEYFNSLIKKEWIQPNKLLIGVLIFFIPKPDRTIRLYIDYYSLNKVIIKNHYPLLLVSKMLD